MEEINRTAFKIASTQGRELLDSRPAVLRSRQRPDPKGREFFLEREAAEAMVDEAREDEPVLADDLRVEAIELFREVNERVRDANEMLQHQEGEALFLCECARQDCTERLTVSLGAYEEVRQVPTHFLVAAGHEHVFPDAERLFETHNGYWVVEKFGEARLAAIKLDPRRRNGQGDLQAAS